MATVVGLFACLPSAFADPVTTVPNSSSPVTASSPTTITVRVMRSIQVDSLVTAPGQAGAESVRVHTSGGLGYTRTLAAIHRERRKSGGRERTFTEYLYVVTPNY